MNKSSVYLCPNPSVRAVHETTVQEAISRHIATLLNCEFRGNRHDWRVRHGDCYYVPADTLVGGPDGLLSDLDEEDFFGGVVPARWVGTKIISHPLWRHDSVAPASWSHSFMEKAGDCVLRGYSVFTLDDALACGTLLLQRGPIRLKLPEFKAGKGQLLITAPMELHLALAGMSQQAIASTGLVIEEHITELMTYSVGQINVNGLTASYVGTQGLTTNNEGDPVYGGSRLVMARGGYEQLLALPVSPRTATAISQARTYEQAALESFDGLILSRRNYDVAQGINAEGEFVSGVLEQSWRIGGASSAEIFGLAHLCENLAVRHVLASSIEMYGEHVSIPDGADVLYQGSESDVGPITKCVRVSEYGSPDRND